MSELSPEHRALWRAQHERENRRRTRVEVQHLMPGDRLRPTQAVILSYPVATLRTPPGKRELRIRRRTGEVANVTWNARTRIGIEPRIT
jgi:hypothetical protein